MKTINIIGCGKVGKTLGRLWKEKGIFLVQDLLNRSPESAAAAAAFIGAGSPVSAVEELRPAEIHLIAASDDAIADCAESLARSGILRMGDIVCHLSGALPSSILAPAAGAGAAVASVHPVKSFADPADAVRSFSGTWCGMEGDERALAVLREAFEAIGGKLFPIDATFKTLYHCGSVFVCNYLNALVEAGLRCYEKGGLPRELALEVMEPLVRGTMENIFRRGPAETLTGPIARGDAAVVGRQLDALEEWDPEMGRLYRGLGRVALDLAREKGDTEVGPLEVLLSQR